MVKQRSPKPRTEVRFLSFLFMNVNLTITKIKKHRSFFDFEDEEVCMGYTIGSARIDERGRTSGGAAGDQKQTSVPDRKGEVSMQEFYVSSKGWYILRPKSTEVGRKMAEAMKRACNNPNIGYDQAQRLNILANGTGSKVKTECDCSSLVRVCIKEASGKDPGNFTTANEAHCLLSSGMFDRLSYSPGTALKVGDVLVTKSKGHTVIVVEADTFPVLRKGSKGSYVKELQTLLNYSGSGAHLSVDGVFGSLTEIAVIAYQKLHGLNADGVVGPRTWAELKN